MNVEVNVKDRVMRPAWDVFSAIVHPARMSQFFISSASGPMQAGSSVEWRFADVERSLTVDVKEIEKERKIVFDWPASGEMARVTITLEPRGRDATFVAINEAGWPMTPEGVHRALGQTQGWTDFLCCMKGYLQHGVNLRKGRSTEDH